MADDDEINERLDDNATGEDESNQENKGLSKPTIIKVAIGVIVLLAGIGSYFFFAPKDKPAEPESISEIDNLIESSDNVTSPNMAIKILEMREEAITLREENLRLKQRIIELESPDNQQEGAGKSETVPKDDKNPTNIKQQAPARKLNANQYIVNYQNDRIAYPSRYETISEPAPKPTWGEFAPIYRGE